MRAETTGAAPSAGAPPAPTAAAQDRAAATPGRRPQRRRHPLTVVRDTVAEGAAALRTPRRQRRLAWVAVGAVVTLALVGWVAFASPLLRVNTVSVSGGDATQQASIRRIAEKSLGQPMLKVDTSQVERDISALPSLSRVDVRRDWPGTIAISVAIRTPMIAASNPQGGVDLIDADGVTYGRADKAPATLPMVTLSNPASATQKAAAAKVMAALDAGQRVKVSKLSVSGAEHVTFTLDGIAVIWGGPTEARLKSATLAVLLRQKGVKSVNVSAPDYPVTS